MALTHAVGGRGGRTPFSDDYCSYDLPVVVDLSAGCSCHVIWCRRQREETR